MDTITTVVLGCALMATAGFSITIKGDAIKSTMSEEANAMPLKNPATPIPSVTHMFSNRDDTKIIKDNTGIDVINEYAAKDIRVLTLNVPCGKSVTPIFASAKFCMQIAISNRTVSSINLHRYIAGTLIGSICILFTAFPLNSML